MRALAKGLFYAHCGWLFNQEVTNRARFAPDLLADRAIQAVDRLFLPLLATTLLLPALIGGLATGSWQGALSAFFWAGLVRMALLHLVTWSVNSICHVVGERPFNSKDKATNFWPLALLSFGESWHNSHHADPTGARQGVLRGQIDPGARLIWIFEKLGWARDVRWPDPARLAAKRNDNSHAVIRHSPDERRAERDGDRGGHRPSLLDRNLFQKRRRALPSPVGLHVRSLGRAAGGLEIHYRQRGDDQGAFSVGGGDRTGAPGAAAPNAAAISLNCLDLVEDRLSTPVENGPIIGGWRVWCRAAVGAVVAGQGSS